MQLFLGKQHQPKGGCGTTTSTELQNYFREFNFISFTKKRNGRATRRRRGKGSTTTKEGNAARRGTHHAPKEEAGEVPLSLGPFFDGAAFPSPSFVWGCSSSPLLGGAVFLSSSSGVVLRPPSFLWVMLLSSASFGLGGAAVPFFSERNEITLD